MTSISSEAIRILRTEAARCRRVSSRISDPTLFQTLEQVAAEFERQAERLELLPDAGAHLIHSAASQALSA